MKSLCFECKSKIIGIAPDDKNTLDPEVVVPLNYFSKFGSFPDLPLINYEISFDLLWSKECIISEISITPAVAGNPNSNPPVMAAAAIQTTSRTFQINNAKFYLPVVTLSINDNMKFLENKKQGFTRKIYFEQISIWNNNTTKYQ